MAEKLKTWPVANSRTGAFRSGEQRTQETRRRSIDRTRPVVNASVILAAYTEQRWEDLLSAVQSVQAQTITPLEVILVIDHNPALLERARQAIPGVRVLENEQGRGLSGARNTGVTHARGAVLIFMDEDAVAEPDWLERLVAHYDRSMDVSGVGGAIKPRWDGGKPGWFPEEFNWVVGCTYRGMPEKTAPVRNLIGANMSFRREVFDAVEGFTIGMGRIGTLPVGCEETELCIRAAQSIDNALFLFDPRAVVHHRVPASRATWRYFFSRCFAEGLSKAQVARSVGSGAGLSNERAYTFRTLPLGVLRGVKDAFLRGDLSGMGRATAILSGLAVTTLGYGIGSVGGRKQVRA